MTAVSGALLSNPQICDAFAEKNRERLAELNSPL
jgi:hypothetical protein